MPLSVSISHDLPDGHFAAVGEFTYKITEEKEHSGPASVIVKKEPKGYYSLVIDEKMYPTLLDGKTPLEYHHANPAKPVKGVLTFKQFHITF